MSVSRTRRSPIDSSYYLVGYSTPTFTTTSGNYQISTVVGIEIGGVYGVWEGVFRIGHVRVEIRRHGR